ncbi:MAG: hypothetical protein AAB352_02760 [Patescibacteria group bacterium]
MKKQKPTDNNKVHIFNVTINENSPYLQEQNIKEKVWRSIAILDSQSLYNLAEEIVNAFGFDFDHCFGFFDNLDSWTKAKVKYELFADTPETRLENPNSKSVEKTKIQQVFTNVGDKMLFLFDYGDNWEFIVELKIIEKPDFKKLYPLLLESAGKAPEQYPAFEDEK